MKVLLKSAKVIDPTSPFHLKKVDILINEGVIEDIGDSISSKDQDKTIDLEDLHVSLGWFDSSVNFGEPGYEERETIKNGLDTAGRSGFTHIALNPDTYPVIDDNGAVTSILSKAKDHPVSLLPIGALTRKSLGKELADLFDMHQAGAIAFGDYKKPVAHANLLKLALQYAQNFGGLVLSFPQNCDIAGKGVVNEEEVSTRLGLRGIPALAEELQIIRDLYILEYTGGKLHIPTISTAKSVELIKTAKEKGLDVSCSVAIHNLVFTDDVLMEFNTNAKVLPPLRTKKDAERLINGLKEGTIDLVTSDHTPIDIEHKKVEFENALYGTIGLESAFGALLNIATTEEAIDLLTRGRKRFGIKEPILRKGEKVNLTLFSPQGKEAFTKDNIFSSSKNSLFLDSQIKGTIFGIIAGKHFKVYEPILK